MTKKQLARFVLFISTIFSSEERLIVGHVPVPFCHVNINAVMLDGGNITIGDHTLIGPNCSFYTSIHPMDYLERRKPQETCKPITIGEDCWLGGNVTVVGGVKIGARSVIGAGSVVVKDIPEDCFAAGNPCRVIRKLNQK